MALEKVLVVDDDPNICDVLRMYLENEGYSVILAYDGEEALVKFNALKPDIILLDVMLPTLDGWQVCREIRKTSNVPIIMVTSRDNEMDELLSLNYGADQYVTKPYNIQILLAKIVGLLKRNQNAGNNPDKIDCGSFILNTAGRIIEKEDKKIELTKNEYKILEYLVLHRQQVISRDEIMDYLWESEEFVDDNTLNVNIKRLRTKLEELGIINQIETRRGQGYILK